MNLMARIRKLGISRTEISLSVQKISEAETLVQ